MIVKCNACGKQPSEGHAMTCALCALQAGATVVTRTPSIQRKIDACPNRAAHVKDEPNGYVAWHEWAERRQRTHTQEVCPRCGFYVIWTRRETPASTPKEQL